ncbi:MAG TPA: Gfo/Idh/MocA family oxidoreductase [Pirellulales bacterium]|jgi:predicted dehydrogenase|nr:Gfo/Idh/MocA family oxidoreductase [Pirellulales bacterium]
MADTTASSGSPEVEICRLRAAMVGMGMIFDETYRPFFESIHQYPLYLPNVGVCQVSLAAVASRTGKRAEAYRQTAGRSLGPWESFREPHAIERLLAAGVDFVCVATPDDRHFSAAKATLEAGKHVLIEKPSVLSLAQLDELQRLAQEHRVLAKVVYHKLLDPDHKKLRTLVADGELAHVNNGYCTLLEPKSISGNQFAEWIAGRNPGTYVAVHYIKLIDFTFGGRLKSLQCTGQRGIVGPADGPTWDSTQLRMIYQYDDGREAAFDIHTSWVTPDNFPGYVEQEVQFRFDNGVWNGHSRKRGVECTVEGRTPTERKITMNNHYNGTFLEPWGERSQRGYGIEVLERFVRELAEVEFGGPTGERDKRLAKARALNYNDLSADRQVVAAVQAMEAILAKHAAGAPNCVVNVNDRHGGLVLYAPSSAEPEIVYSGRV